MVFQSSNHKKTTEKLPEGALIPSFCIKNKLRVKITILLTKTKQPNQPERFELIVPADGKECKFELKSGIYEYEIILANNEKHKKGELRIDQEIVLIVK